MMMDNNIVGNQQALGQPFSGTLESKSGSVMMPWKNRKTILTKDGIEIMHDGDKDSVKHHLSFDDKTIIAVAETAKGKGGFLRTAFAPNQDAFKFCVITSSGMEEFNAHSAEERNEWIKHICELADKRCPGGGFVVSVGADTDFQYIQQWVQRWTTNSMDLSAGIVGADSVDLKENADPSKNTVPISAQGDLNFQGFVPFDQWLYKLEPEAYSNRKHIRENRKQPGKPAGEKIRDYMANKMVQNFSENSTPKMCNMLLEGMCVLLARSEQMLVRRYHSTPSVSGVSSVLPKQQQGFKAGEGSSALVKGQPGIAPNLDLNIEIPRAVQMDLLCMISSLRALISTYRFEDATTPDSQMRFLRKLAIHRMLMAAGSVLMKLQEEAKEAIQKGAQQVQKVIEENVDTSDLNMNLDKRNAEQVKNKAGDALQQTAEKIEKPAEKLLEMQRAGALKEVAAGLVGKGEEGEGKEGQDKDFNDREGKDFNREGKDFNKDFNKDFKDQNKGQGFQQGSSIGGVGIHSQGQQHGIGGSQLGQQGLSSQQHGLSGQQFGQPALGQQHGVGSQQHGQGATFGMIGAGQPISQQHGGLIDHSKDNKDKSLDKDTNKKDWEKEIDAIRQGKSVQGVQGNIGGHYHKTLGQEHHGQQGVGGVQHSSDSQPVHSLGQHGQQGMGGIEASLGSQDNKGLNKDILDKDNKSHDNKNLGGMGMVGVGSIHSQGQQHGQQGLSSQQHGIGGSQLGQQGLSSQQHGIGGSQLGQQHGLEKDNKQFAMGGFHEGKQSDEHDRSFQNRSSDNHSSSLDNKFQSLGMGAGRMNQGGHSKEGDFLNKNQSRGQQGQNEGGLSEEQRRNLRQTGAELREQVLERFRAILHPLLSRMKDEVSPLVQSLKERVDTGRGGEGEDMDVDVDDVVNDVTHSLSKAVIQYVERNIDKLEGAIERQLEVVLELVADMKEAGKEGKEMDTNELMDKMIRKAGEATGEDPDKAQQMVQKTAEMVKQMRDTVQSKMREVQEHGGMAVFGTAREALESAVLERCDDLICMLRDIVGKGTTGAMMGLLFIFGTGMSSERAPVVSTEKGVFPPVMSHSAPATEQV